MKIDRKKLPLYISGVILCIGIIVNMYDAYKISVWWHNSYDPDGTAYDTLLRTLNNFISEWVIIDFKSAVFTLSLIVFVGILIKNVISRIIRKKQTTPEKAAKTEGKVGNVLFVLSFLPFVCLAGGSVISMFAGVHAGLFGNGPVIYGFEAFRETFLWYGLALCILPVLPAMLIFQIVHIVKKVRAKKNSTQ